MGKFSKSVGKHKTPKATVPAKALFIRKTYKKSKRITDMGIKQAQSIQGNVTRAISGLSHMFFCNIMRVQEKISRGVLVKMLNKIQHKLGCVNDNLTSWEDIEAYEVKSTDSEFYPIKWVDYKPIQHDYNYMLMSIPAKNDKEAIHAITKVEVVRYVEHITHHFELCIMSALHDYFGYGITRLKRIIFAYRKMIYLSREKLHEIIEQVRSYNVFQPDETDDAVLEKHERFWSVCLLHPDWEGKHLASTV